MGAEGSHFFAKNSVGALDKGRVGVYTDVTTVEQMLN